MHSAELTDALTARSTLAFPETPVQCADPLAVAAPAGLAPTALALAACDMALTAAAAHAPQWAATTAAAHTSTLVVHFGLATHFQHFATAATF